MNVGGYAHTVAVWGDGLPSILPEVDFVLVARPGPDGKGVFGFVPWAQVTELLTAIGYQTGPDGFNLDYETPPKPVIDFVSLVAPVDPSEIVRLSPDRVLDGELVSRVLVGRKRTNRP